MPSVSTAARSLAAAILTTLSTALTNVGTFTPEDARPARVASMFVQLADVTSLPGTLTFEIWSGDTLLVPQTTVPIVAAPTANAGAGVVLIDLWFPGAATLTLKAKLAAGTATISGAQLLVVEG